MVEVGDFDADGRNRAKQATRGGKPIAGIMWEPVTPLEAMLFGVRKGGYHLLTAQEDVKDPNGALPHRWQNNLGAWEGMVQEAMSYLGRDVYVVELSDISDTASLQGILQLSPTVRDKDGNVTSRGFEPGAVNEFAFLMSVARYDLNGQLVTDPAHDQDWGRLFVEFGTGFNTRFNSFMSPKVDSLEWKANDRDLDVTKDAEPPKPFPHFDLASGFVIGGSSSYLKHFQWRRVGRMYDVRFAAWIPHDTKVVTFANWIAAVPEDQIPETIGIGDGSVVDFKRYDELTGGRYFSRLLVAAEEPRPNVDSLAALAVRVDTVADTMGKNRQVIENRAAQIEANVYALHGAIRTTTTWLGSLTDTTGKGFYAKVEDIPATETVGVVRTGNEFVIHVRGSDKALHTLSSYNNGTIEATNAINAAINFVAGLKSAAGSPVSSADLDALKADVRKAEADILSLAKTAGREIAEVATFQGVEPLWPTGLASSPDGSLMVRKGQVQTVNTTIVNNNGFTGSHQYAVSFGQAERGKSVIARKSVKASDANGRIEMWLQTAASAGGILISQATLAYVNGAWAATGGTVTIDEGRAVLSFPFTFPANSNADILCWTSPGDVQLLATYDAAVPFKKTPTDLDIKDTDTGTTLRLPLDLVSKVASNSAKTASNELRISTVEGKLDATTPVKTPGGDTRSDATPFITIPDRAGVRFDKLKFTFRDPRKNAAGGWSYPSRTTVLEVPATWLDMGAVAGRTGWTAVAQTFDDPTSLTTPKATITRNSLFRTLSYNEGARADYDIWLNFRRNADSWDIWFQGQHITTDRKPMNQYCGVYDIVAEYVVDAGAVDPKLKPLTDRMSALEAKAAPDLSLYAKRKDLAKKQGRAKLWSPAVTDLAVTLGGVAEDTAPAFAPSADIDAKVFTVVPAAPGVRAAKVDFTVTGLVAGQRYELAIEVGSGLNTGFALAGMNPTTEDVTNWKKYRQTITATGPTYAGSYTVTHGAVVHGPAVYTLPGLYVQDEALAAYQVAEPADVTAAETRANGVTNFLAQTVQGQGSRISALEARPSGSAAPDPQWFSAERDYGKTYLRRTKTGTQAQSISFDFVSAGTTGVPMSVNLPAAGAPISGWPISQFWGVATLFLNLTPPGGVAMTIAVCASIDGVVEIGVGAASGASSASIGRVRNVVIDGIVADRLT